MDIRIIVSVVCYNNEDEVIRFADMISKQTISKQIHLVITYNCGNQLEYLKTNIEKINISAEISNPHNNLGYLSGCCFGIDANKEILNNTTWIAISNTDIEFETTDFLERILENIPKNVWAIGPRIKLKKTGQDQNPFFEKRPSVQSMKFRKLVYSNLLFFNIYFSVSKIKTKIVIKRKKSKDKNRFVYALHGSFFIVNKQLFEKIDEVKNHIFMYGEEILVAELANRNNKRCYFRSDVGLIHNENQVTSLLSNKSKQTWFNQSTKYLTTKYFT